MLIINGKVYLEETVLDNGFVLLDGEKIVDYGDMEFVPSYNGEIVDAKGKYVLPGFIDQHIHGANGSDHMDATLKDLENIATFLPKEGTTSYLPTTMTQSLENVGKALETIVEYMDKDNGPGQTEMLGIHVEGPFISKKHVGAQNPDYVQVPTIENFDVLWEKAGHRVKLITYAPEEAEKGFTQYLRSLGVVPSAGHTDSYFKEIAEEVPNGLANMTHFHNAMTPHHHRNPGAVTAGFVYPELKAELIVDGIHLAPETVNATFQIKGADGVIVITDAMRAKGLPDGDYDLGGQMVHKEGKECRIDNGALAGSVAEMDFVVRNFKEFTNCSMRDIVKVSSENSAKQLNVFDRKGSIRIGKDADIIICDEDINIYTTICRGKTAYTK